MEENKKFYSQKTIAFATYLGGPLAAGFLIRQNCINLKRDRQGSNSLFIGILSTFLILFGLLSIPEEIIDKIPNALFPAIYTGIVYFIVDKIQGDDLKKHKENNGEFYSNWKASVIAIIGMLIIFAGIFGYIYTTEPDSNLDTISYDNEVESFFKNEEIPVQRNLSIRGNLRVNEIGIKFPNKASIGEGIIIELINTKENLAKIKILESSNYTGVGMGSSSKVTYKDGVMTGTYTRKFKLTFNAKGEYEINESWFENLPKSLNLRPEKIKVN